MAELAGFISGHFVLENIKRCLRSNLVSLASFGKAYHRTSMSDMNVRVSERGQNRPSAVRMKNRASRTHQIPLTRIHEDLGYFETSNIAQLFHNPHIHIITPKKSSYMSRALSRPESRQSII